MTRSPLVRMLAGVFGLVLAATACGGDQGGSEGSGGSTLAIVNASGALWTCNFNPFAPSPGQAAGVIWEPLTYINTLTGKEKPWLGTKYEWSDDGKTLTYTTREGVKWSDGKPFTAKDVAYTFNLGKDNEALDTYALWGEGVLESVKADSDTQVTFTFKRVSTSSFFYIAGQTWILPEHVWKTIEDPVKAAVKKPVGTGPYTVGSCTPQAITYAKSDALLAEGQAEGRQGALPGVRRQPAGQPLPLPGQGRLGRSVHPEHRQLLGEQGQGAPQVLVPAGQQRLHRHQRRQGPAVGQAGPPGAVVRGRPGKVSKDAMYGYQPPANQAGIAVPTFQDWYDEAEAMKYGYSFDPAKVAQRLQAAGFTKGADGKIQTPEGKPFKLSIINNGGFTDWVAAVQVLKSSFAKAGIELDTLNLNGNEYNRRLSQGQFELAYMNANAGPTPYYEMRDVLYGAYAKPVGTDTSRNYTRWKDKATDELIRKYDTLLDEGEQKDVVRQLQQIMLEEVPVVPVTEGVAWSQTDTTRFTNWPTKDNPYANPAPYAAPDWGVVLLELEPVEK